MSSGDEFEDAASEQHNNQPDTYQEDTAPDTSSTSSKTKQKRKDTDASQTSDYSQAPDGSTVSLVSESSHYSEHTEQADATIKNTLSKEAVAAAIDATIDEEEPESERTLGEIKPETPTSKLPNRKSIQECLRIDQQEASPLQSAPSSIQNLDSISSTYDKSSSNYLLQSKFNQLNSNFQAKDVRLKESINSGTENIKKTFNDIKNTVGGFNDMFEYKIDWDFWTQIVNDYESVIKHDSAKLDKLIMSGIPKEFRGIIWQLVAKSKNFQLEEFYINLKSETSIHEKSIKRDLSRTSFFTNVEQVNKGEELFNVIKAYSLFDPDVGYTQGMIFITIPLIMNLSDAECFCLLVTLMKDYRLRDLFSPEMKGLHLFLYEFDRLLENYSPELYNHLVKQGIKSSMYASQWFLTFFAYKFPLDIVLRIYDIIITQGIESILKFAVNLMIKNKTNLLALKFDKLLGFLKDKLFNIYINEEFIDFKDEFTSINNSANGGLKKASRRFSLLPGSSKRNSVVSNGSGPSCYYKLDDLVIDSMEINVEPVDLTKYENEFEDIYRNETSKAQDIEKIKIENGTLRHKIKELETQYTNLNRDHIDIVQKMVDIKVKLPEVLHDNDELDETIAQLKIDIEELESKTIDSPKLSSEDSLNSIPLKSPALPTTIEHRIQQLLEENAQETEKFANLEDELENLTIENERLTNELKGTDGKGWFGRWGK